MSEIDALVHIGGGEQSLDEAAKFKSRGGKVYERELEALSR
ncbi:MAG TPA: hypothetical protein VFZ58_05660 [Candidatus Saccharimonadales bacterium]